MRLIVTGATGFIGSNLLSVFNKYDEIICLTRQLKKENTYDNVTFIQTDYKLDSLRQIFQENDVLIHLAGERLTKNDLNPLLFSFIETNIKLTENLLIAACETKAKQVLLVSSIGVYSEMDSMPYLEDVATNPGTTYGLSKLMGEQLVRYYCLKHSVKHTVVRLSQCYGVGEKDTPVLMKFIKEARQSQKLIVQDNEFYLDEIYIKDLVEVMLLLVEQAVEGVFNIGGGKAYSILEMAKAVNSVFDNEGNIEVISGTKKNNDKNFHSILKVREELNWSPKFDLENALIDMKQIYNLKEAQN